MVNKVGFGPDVYRIFLAQLISVTGDKLFTIALSWWIVDQDNLENRELVLGLLLGICTLPMALSGPLLGPIIDRYSRRTCMVMADIARLLLMSVLAYLIHTHSLNLPTLFALCILIFSFEPLFSSSVSASLSALSHNAKMLSQLVALESAIPNFGAVMGALFGSFALAILNTETAVWINATSFLLSMLLVLGLPPLRAVRTCYAAETSPGGYNFLRRHMGSMKLMICFGLANFFVAPLFFYLPLFARDILHTDGAGLAQLELSFAAGNLIVLVWLFARPPAYFRVRWLRFVLVAASGPFYYALTQTQEAASLLAILVAWGSSVAFVTYLAIISFQRSIPEEYKGRFFALFNSVCTISLPLSFACAGFLSTKFSLYDLMMGNALCITIVSLAFLTVPNEPMGKIEHAETI